MASAPRAGRAAAHRALRQEVRGDEEGQGRGGEKLHHFWEAGVGVLSVLLAIS
jgi:hypothetical protein